MVGAFALGVHGHPRATGDMDVWVHPTPLNAERVMRALRRFGAPLQAVNTSDFTADDFVLQIGVAPSRIDLLTSLSGVTWDEAWPTRTQHAWGPLSVPVIGRDQPIRNKRAVGRPKDLADLEALEN